MIPMVLKHRPDITSKKERLSLYRGLGLDQLQMDLKYSISRGFTGDAAEIRAEIKRRKRR